MNIKIFRQLSAVLCAGFVFSGNVNQMSASPVAYAEEISYDEKDIRLISESSDGVKIYYKSSSYGLIIDGSGTFTMDEWEKCVSDYRIDYAVIGKCVQIPDNNEKDPMNNFLLGYSHLNNFLYGYSGSNLESKLNLMLDYITDIKIKNNSGTSADWNSLPYKMNIIPDDTNPLEVIPEEKQTDAEKEDNVLAFCGGTESGVKFYYKKADHGVIIEGNGTFTEEEYNSVINNHVEYIVIGKDVIIPESIVADDVYLNTFLMKHCVVDGFQNKSIFSVYTYSDSDTENKFNKMINYFKNRNTDAELKDAESASFKLNIISDETNPYSIYCTEESTMFLRGDINGDGKVDLTDLSELSLYLIGDTKINNAQKIFSDIDDDDQVSLADLARLRQHISKQVENWDSYKTYIE